MSAAFHDVWHLNQGSEENSKPWAFEFILHQQSKLLSLRKHEGKKEEESSKGQNYLE